jgi:hypothetical protein
MKSKPLATSMLEGDESTFQQQQSDPNKITKLAEEEWDRSDLWLRNYAQNSHQTLLLKMSNRHIWSWTGYVWSRRIYPVKVPVMSVHPETFFPTLILELWGIKLDETWTQWSPQDMEYIPKRSFSQM